MGNADIIIYSTINQRHNRCVLNKSGEWSSARMPKLSICFLVFQVFKVVLVLRPAWEWPGNYVIDTHFAFDLYHNLSADNKSWPPPVSAFRLLPPHNHEFQQMNNRALSVSLLKKTKWPIYSETLNWITFSKNSLTRSRIWVNSMEYRTTRNDDAADIEIFFLNE